MQWPVQIKLLPTVAPFYENANLLVAADYYEKLVEIIRNNSIKCVTVVRMNVPCCGGIESAVKRALQDSGKFLPWQVVIVSTEGRILG